MLNKEDPKVIFVTGWSRTADIIAICWAAYKCKPLVIMSDSNEMDFQRWSITEWIKRRLITCASGGLCAGKQSFNYLCKLGVDKSKIFGFYNVVDNNHFSHDPIIFNVHNKFLIVSRLVEKKNIKFFLNAYVDYVGESLACGLQPWQLSIVGNGPLLKELVEYVEAAGITDSVQFLGEKSYDELPVCYQESDILILPSKIEQWGLVVNEAMAAGLPVIVSSRVGAASDLVIDGENGFILDPNRKEAWVNCLLNSSSLKEEQLEKMSTASKKIIEKYNTTNHAVRISKLVDNVSFRAEYHQRLFTILVGVMLVFFNFLISLLTKFRRKSHREY